MRLKLKIFLLLTVIFIFFMSITWFLSWQMTNKVNQQWAEQFAERQVTFDKYRTLSPLIREIAQARQMATDPAIIDMVLHEADAGMRSRGIAAMERYRFNFRDHCYFAAFAKSGNYYFNDAANRFAGKQLRYVLSPGSGHDKWFYATLADGKEYQVNLDPDVHLNVTKVWINVLIKNGTEVLGLVGTGIDLTDFLNETVSLAQHGVINLFIDKSMAIQLHNDPQLIDYMTIAKDIGQRTKVDRLLKNPADIRRVKQVMQKLEDSSIDSATLWVDFEGEQHLLGVSYLPEIGWYDLTLMDKKTLHQFEDMIEMPLLFGLAFLFSLLAMGLALHRWILNPVASLRISTDRIQRGDFNIELPAAGDGEIADLSRSFARMAEFVRDTNQELERKVRARTEDLHRLTEVDPLTGLLNRRGMMERFEKEIARQARQDGSLGLLLLDLDHFKRINDSYGHAAGDLALCEVAKVINASKRSYDHAARWGGEEFLILLPDCARDDLQVIAERIRVAVSALKIQAGGKTFSFTTSIGAHHPVSPETSDTMLIKVDNALYAAKDAGRDCVVFSDMSITR